MNDQNAAASRNNRMAYLGNAASDFQRNALVNRQMSNQQAMQSQWLKSLFGVNDYMKKWLQFDENNPLGIQNNTGK
jgi:hypothetical protein